MSDEILNDLVLENKIKKIYLQEKKNLLLEKDTWFNTFLDVVGIFDPTGGADFINGVIRIYKGDYFFGFLSLISAVPYVGDAIAKPLMAVNKGSKLVQNTNKALKLSKAGKVDEAAKLLDEAAKGNKLMNGLISRAADWVELIKRGVDALPLRRFTLGPRNMIKDWCDLFLKVANNRRKYQAGAETLSQALRAGKIATDAKAATKLVSEYKKMINQGFFRNVKLDRLKGVSFLKPWSAGWMAKYIWPGVTFGLLYRNRDIVSLARRTRFYWGFIDLISQSLGLTLPEDVTPEQLYKYASENEIENKFKQYVNSPEGQKYWDEDMQGAQLPSIEGTKSTPDVGSKSGRFMGGQTKPDIIDFILDDIFS